MYCYAVSPSSWLPSVESGSFEYYISSHLEESIEFVDDSVVHFSVVGGDIRRCQDTFCLFSETVEECINLLHGIIGC